MPLANTQMEDAIFVLAGHVFLKTSDYLLCLDALARLLGPARLQYLLLFLAFVRTAHYWTETHPEIAFEDDVNKLLATHEALAECILNDPEARDSVRQSLLDELPALRFKADKAIGLLAAIVDSSRMPSSARLWTASSPVGTRVRSGCLAIPRAKRSASTFR